jgi:hypothetical protein
MEKALARTPRWSTTISLAAEGMPRNDVAPHSNAPRQRENQVCSAMLAQLHRADGPPSVEQMAT